jgi:LL-diaminopimelate aminotransferase
MKPATRMGHLTTHFFAALGTRLAELKSQGHSIIRLDQGSPDLPPPPHIIETLVSSARRSDTHGYQTHRGTPELRQAWAEYYSSQWGVQLDPDHEILPLLGSKEGIFHLSQALLNPGDIALIPDPGYVTYTRGALFSEAHVHQIRLDPQRGFLPDLDAIPVETLAKTKLLWLNYPNNPTGASATLTFFQKAINLARRYDLLVCHDAAYAQVYFDKERPRSILQVSGASDVAVEFQSLSKSHHMAGWRSGALLGNKEIVKILYTFKTNYDSGHFRPILDASTAALIGDQAFMQERNQILRRRRDALLAGLEAIGLHPINPRASLYIWCPVPDGWDCESFALEMLEETDVSITPGTVFGQNGQGYVRISLTAPQEEIEIAVVRLKNWLPSATPKRNNT